MRACTCGANRRRAQSEDWLYVTGGPGRAGARQRIRVCACRYTLGEVKEGLLDAMGLNTELEGSAMQFLRCARRRAIVWGTRSGTGLAAALHWSSCASLLSFLHRSGCLRCPVVTRDDRASDSAPVGVGHPNHHHGRALQTRLQTVHLVGG